jgi:hypothetical protein
MLGDLEGADVSERTVVLVADTPSEMTDGNWRLGVIIGDGASEEHIQALGSDFGGEKGGPPAMPRFEACHNRWYSGGRPQPPGPESASSAPTRPAARARPEAST